MTTTTEAKTDLEFLQAIADEINTDLPTELKLTVTEVSQPPVGRETIEPDFLVCSPLLHGKLGTRREIMCYMHGIMIGLKMVTLDELTEDEDPV